MGIKFANNAKTTLSAAITSAATTFSCTSLAAFPALGGSDYFYATLLDADGIPEIIKVTATSGNSVTVCERAQDGTSARDFDSGAFISMNVTRGILEALATGALLSGGVTINISGNAATADLADVATVAEALDHTLAISEGGTGATTAGTARTNLGAAASGANSDITSLAAPALGAATATTQAYGNATTKVATMEAADRLRDVPASATTTTAEVGDRGKCVSVNAAFTIPSGVFDEGDVFSMDNITGSSISIVQGSGLTLRLASTTSTGNRAILAHGLATVRFRSATEAVITGSVT